MTDNIAVAQQEAARAERSRSVQVAAQQKRHQRDDERNAKRGRGGGGIRVVSARGRRAPRSASQFHFTKKYSNRAGKNRAPTSSLRKLAYDFRLTLVDEDGKQIPHGSDADDLDYTYISHSINTPKDALDLALLAAEAERSAGRQSRSRQMAHYDIALPADLSDEAGHALVRQICDDTRNRMDDVPVFAAVHRPHGGNGNWHVHISHPLRHIETVGDDGAFKMGERIMHEQRPNVRRAAGLPTTNHGELRSHREATARLIHDALISDGHDPQTAARWRHGHLKLAQQVEQAVQRGDVQFVIDNHGRAPTKHEGPAAHHGKIENAASEHNSDTQGIDAALLTRVMINNVLQTAQRLGVQSPEHLKLLAVDMGLQLHYVKNRDSDTDAVQGVQWQIIGGPRISGAEAGCSLGNLKRRMSWDNTPSYQRHVSRSGETFEQYKAILDKAGKGRLAGRGISILDRILDIHLQEKELAIQQAQANASNKEQQADGEIKLKQRPKRASSKNRAAATSNAAPPKTPVNKEAVKMDPAAIKKLMGELTKLPDDKPTPPPPAAAKAAPKPTLRVPTDAEIAALTQEERQFLRDEYDYRVGGLDFKSPALDAQRRLERLYSELQKIKSSEPEQRYIQVKKLFRKPKNVESPEYIQWGKQLDQAQENYDTAHKKTAENFQKIYRDPQLFALLPAFRLEQQQKQETDTLKAEAKKELEEEQRKQRFHEQNKSYAVADRDDTKKTVSNWRNTM